MKQHSLLELAKKEIREAREYYDSIDKNIGRSFVSQISHSLDLIKQNPLAFPAERKNIRKCLVKKFPYKILYAIEDNNILVLAVMHQKRKPNYWLNRM